MKYILLLIAISTILSYLILKFIYRILFKSKKKVSKFLVFLGSIGLIIFYYTPYSYYLEPSFYEFKEMCKMQYDFIFKGVGDAETINKYRDENGFIEGVWYTGIYKPKGYIEDLYWEEQWINCNNFYDEWDKDWYDKVQKGEIYGQ